MAKRKAKRNNAKRRKTVRVNQLNAAVSLRPKRIQLVADPPQRSLTLEQSAVIRINCTGSSSQGGLTVSTDRYVPSTLAAQSGKHFYQLTTSDLVRLVRGYAGLADNLTFEVAMKKVAVWGPLPVNLKTETVCCLAVDVGYHTSGLVVSDRCAPNHRSRCGITIPYVVWHTSGPTIVVRYDTGEGDTSTVHTMDLSITWRTSRAF